MLNLANGLIADVAWPIYLMPQFWLAAAVVVVAVVVIVAVISKKRGEK